jgi:hypothetical protein
MPNGVQEGRFPVLPLEEPVLTLLPAGRADQNVGPEVGR